VRKRKLPEQDGVEMELTPMIDIVFNLLIFFMLQKFQTTEGVIKAYLPKSKGKGEVATTLVQDVRVKCLWVDASGRRVRGPDGGHAVLKLGDVQLNRPGELDGADYAEHPAWGDLGRRLERLAGDYVGPSRRGLPVIIDARPEVPTRIVVLALNEVVRAGVEDVSFAAPELPYR